MDRGTVCITGASRGIGKALTLKYADEGYKVLAVSRSHGANSKIESSKNLIEVIADITTQDGCEIIRSAAERAGGINVLIHNAGMLVHKPFKDITGVELREVYEVNVFAPFILTQSLLPHMKRCHVVSLSSIGGVENSVKFPGLSAYSSSKAALNCISQMLAEEFKDTEHSFNCLALGSVQTEMFSNAFPSFQAACSPDVMAQYIYDYANSAQLVQNGKIISVSRSNP
ncbi:MAG: SDR family NAD(P)-dependent oxidoreductase [Bacteroidota bacterium]